MNVTKNIENSSIIVQWEAVDDSLTITYTVTLTSERDHNNNIQSATLREQSSYTITGLTLDTVYTITVTAVNKCGTGPEFTTSISFTADTTSTTSSIRLTVTASTNPMTIMSTANPNTAITTTDVTSTGTITTTVTSNTIGTTSTIQLNPTTTTVKMNPSTIGDTTTANETGKFSSTCSL